MKGGLHLLIENFILAFPGYEKVPACVPCSVYSTLLQNNLIPDPFVGDRAEALSYLSDLDCVFTTEFELSEKDFLSEKMFLECGGLDTLCELYLNGKKIGFADNFHRTWRFDLRPAARQGKNSLEIRVSSPTEYMKEAQKRHWLWGEEHPMEEGYLHTTSGIGHIRKPAYMFGWDWGPRLPDMGIYGPIRLCCRNDPEIAEVEVLQTHKENAVRLDVKTMPDSPCENISAVVALYSPEGEKLAEKRGFEVDFTVENPSLWWPNGYGAQPLYRLETTLYRGERVLDTDRKQIGLRTLSVSREKDKWGREFCFIVNGKKIFAMGACYIPEDSLVSRITADKSEKLIASCAEANFNCLRIWGGGFYPSDEFYDLCDRYGILLWQDFMFACLNVRMSERFTENVAAEATEAIKRLRHHASLALLCGNNEMEYGLMYWDWLEHNDELVKADYLKLYENLLPDLCEKYAPQTFYWPSSPSSGGGFFEPGSENDGDVHHWETWIEGKPMEDFRKHYFRFCSEFGFQAFPEMKTIASYTEERDPLSYEITYHQKRVNSDHAMLTYQAQRYLYSRTFEQFVYASQIVQGEAIQYAVEHFRRNRGRCMGATYWQLNDCWPGQTWSSLDYYGRWKGLHYFAKRFFSRFLVSLHREEGTIIANVSSEYLSPFSGTVHFSLKDSSFRTVYSEVREFTLDSLSAKDILSFATEGYADRARELFAECVVTDLSGNPIGKSVLLLTKPRFFRFENPEITVDVMGDDGNYQISVSAGRFAHFVAITSDLFELHTEDNYFDITDSGKVILKAESNAPDAAALLASLKVMSVYNIGK